MAMSPATVTIVGASGAQTGIGNLTADTVGLYCGFSLRETSGTVGAVVRIRENNASGKIIETIALAAAESAREYYQTGIRFTGLLYVEIVSGAVEGSLRVA